MSSVLPGVVATLVPPATEPSPLRSDVAGFLGRCRRGPVGEPVRIEGWRAFEAVFGGLDETTHLPWAVRGYFENGGQVAWILRVAEPGAAPTRGVWDLDVPAAPDVLAQVAADIAGPTPGVAPQTLHRTYEVTAATPGAWADGLRVELTYVRFGRGNRPELDVVVRADREPTEHWIGLDARKLADEVNARSRLVRLQGVDPAVLAGGPGPGTWRWEFTLGSAAVADGPMFGVYRQAGERLADLPEVALIVLPDLYDDLPDRELALAFLREQLRTSDRMLDRMVVVDPPRAIEGPDRDLASDLVDHADELRKGQFRATRSGALYHPWLRVPNPLGGSAQPLRSVPPSGHVAGVISRLDRERGAHHTPANGRLFEAVGVVDEPPDEDLIRLHRGGINRVRCHPRDGLVVWGGRTIWNARDDGEFIAHRRLIHRLVRAIRRVAAPLVFENNGPELWLALIRGVGTVLLSAYRGGALKGTRPDHAFRIQCDEETNPPENIDLGICTCKIELAPATPMEFIELRIRLSRDGALEVLTP